MDIRGRVVIVTGASSGIGAATATHLASLGATVVAVARRADRLANVIEQCRTTSPDSRVLAADVSRRDNCDALVAEVVAEFGRVDVLVNNAGVPMRRHATVLTAQDVDQVMDVNFRGPVWLALAVLPGMVAQGEGAIVNVTSVAASIPVPHEAAYGASKAALTAFTHGFAVDLAGTGVTASVVSPGPIATEIWDKGQEANKYDGKTFPASVVAQAIADAIRTGRMHQTAPRRYGALGAIYNLPGVGRGLRWGLVRFAGHEAPDRS